MDFAGRPAWILAADATLMAEPPLARGVVLLPRDDPYVGQRDRVTLAPTKQLQHRLWTAQGTTAVVLVNGHLAALWRGRKQGRHFIVAAEPLQPLSKKVTARLEAEAVHYAAFRGATEVSVEIVSK